ncbi:hypothetical protein Adt_18797 [Abeliophyllum distichum]|uniref:Uncharacterized protein n=1 Tax=Abeliophyllum distichum TaxID=126358 RepID=A0ABD1TKE7_9LAMI
MAAGTGAVLPKEREGKFPTASTRTSATLTEKRVDEASPIVPTAGRIMGFRINVVLDDHAKDMLPKTLYHFRLQTSRWSKMTAAQGDPSKHERCMPPITISPFRMIITGLDKNPTSIVNTSDRWLLASSFESGSSEYPPFRPITMMPFENPSLRPPSPPPSVVPTVLRGSRTQLKHIWSSGQ